MMAEGATASTLTQTVCRFAAGLRFRDIPQDVREKAALHILDAVGCGVAGADSDLAQSMLAYIGLEHQPGPAPVLGTRLALGPAAAAFANSACMNALDFDDGVEVDGVGMGHPGATIVAAALSGLFLRPVSGEDFVTAVVAAYELNNRFIHAMQPSMPRFREVYGVCQHQALGAAVAFGLLAGLDAAGLENAVGLACTLANVPSLRKYNFDARPLVSFKDFNASAAEAGVRAVQMHQCGIVGSKAVLDGQTGFWRMLGSDRFDADVLTGDLGDRWALLDSAIKPYPVCRWMHCSMEAFESLILAHALTPDAIDAVVVHTSAGLARDFMDAAPATMVDAQFSFPFAFSAMALGLSPAREWYRAHTLRRRDLLGLAGRITAEIDPEIDDLMGGERRPAGRVSVTTGARRFDSGLIRFALGSRQRPLGRDRIERKFLENVSPVLGQPRASEMSRALLDIPSNKNAASVFAGMKI